MPALSGCADTPDAETGALLPKEVSWLPVPCVWAGGGIPADLDAAAVAAARASGCMFWVVELLVGCWGIVSKSLAQQYEMFEPLQ